MANVTQFPRAVRPAPIPLGLYFRAGHNDHRVLSDLIAAGDAACSGIVIDAQNRKRHAELVDQALEQKIDVILDPKTQESATPGGYTESLGRLPWGVRRPHTPDDFTGTGGRTRIKKLCDFVLEHGFTQVISPTHYLPSVESDWLQIDIDVTRRLRAELDKKAPTHIPIVYSLAIPYALLRDKAQRRYLIDACKNVPASALWLKVGGLGSHSSATATRNYIEAASEFHGLGIPVIADHMGGVVGLSLLAFGAVGGLAHGVTFGERFDSNRWQKPSQGPGFTPPRRVYIGGIDLFLDQKQAEDMMNASSRNKSLFGCKDAKCCHRGVKDMLANPARHFMMQRIHEIADLSRIPEQLRPQRFLDKHLRPATDLAVAAAGIDWKDSKMIEKSQKHRKRLDTLRVALGDQVAKHPPRSFALHPQTRAMRG